MKIVIVGKSASGKDYLMSELNNMGFKIAVKHTTRPMRTGEIDGETYHYINNTEFNDLINKDQILVYQEFDVKGDTWYYGMSKQSINISDVVMLTPHELSQVCEEYRKSFHIIYLDIDIYVRYKRLYNRKDTNDDILRRIHNDEWDFRFFKDYDTKITEEKFNVNTIVDLIYKNKSNQRYGISFMVKNRK